MGNSSDSQRSGRFCSHPNIITNEVITHRIQVKGQYLYFQPKNPAHTFGYISQQYQTYKNTPLILENLQVSISESLPIGIINSSQNLQKAIQKIIDDLQDQQTRNKVTKVEIESNFIKIQIQDQPSTQLFLDKILVQKKIEKQNQQLQKQITLKINDRGKIFTQPYVLKKKKYSQLMDQIANLVVSIKFMKKKKFSQNRQKEKEQQQQNAIDKQKYQEMEKRPLVELFDHDGLPIPYGSNNIFEHIQDKMTVLLHEGNSCFYQNSSIIVYQQEKFSQMFIFQAFQEERESLALGTLNLKEKTKIEYDPNYEMHDKVFSQERFYLIELEQKDKQFKRKTYLQRHQLLLDQNYEWIRADQLTLSMFVYGVTQQPVTPTLFKVISINEMYIQTNKVYKISSPKFSNIIIDGIIVHNDNTIKLFCHQINNAMSKRQINVFPSQKFSQRFHQTQCYYGGRKVQKNQTFGDYYLSNNDIIYLNKTKTLDRFKEIIVSTKQSQTSQVVNKSAYNQEKLYACFDKLKPDYYGILEGKIIQFSRKTANKLYQKGITHIVGVKNGLAERMNFEENIIPNFRPMKRLINIHEQFLPQFQNAYCYYQKQTSKYNYPNQTKLIQKEEAFPIFLYTTNEIFEKMNKFLRDRLILQNRDNYFFIPSIIEIINSLKLTSKYEGLCYRGIKNARIDKIFGTTQNNQTVCFNSFTSTSIDQQRAFPSQNGILMTIISRTGRKIYDLSKFPRQKEVLFPPFTNFFIKTYDQKPNTQTITLEEIPTATSNSNNLLFWVDDNPQHNRWIAKYFEKLGIQVIEVTSTKIMKLIIKNFFKIYKMLGKKIVVITDMVRVEEGVENKMAGQELLDIIYKNYSLTIRSFVYISPKYVEETKQKFHYKQYFGQFFSIIGDKQNLKNQVEQAFK